MKQRKMLLPLLLAAALVTVAPTTSFSETRVPVKLPGKKVLPLRVLSKPYATIYSDNKDNSPVVQDNLPAFQPFYVYTAPTAEDRELENGWYEVGSDNRGTVVGWMKQDDLFEWKQALCLAYTLPLGRKPVLMFDSRGYLKELAAKDDDTRIAETEGLYKTIDSNTVPPDFPVKSVEPKKAVDISNQFYLLPILDYESIEIGPMEGRLVRLAAVTNAAPDAREKSDIRTNREYLAQAGSGSGQVSKETLSGVNFDVVWVVDTTVSMQPFIDQALQVVKDVSKQLGSEEEAKKSLHFGIWGYRDSEKDIPGIGYTTHNYTPQLQNIDDFITTLESVKVTKVDSVDYAEDLFSGITEGITNTAWTPDSVRYMIVVADAPAHKAGHKWNLSGQDETSLHGLAADRSMNITAIHLKNPRASKFNPLAEEQLTVLSTKGQSDSASYLAVDSTRPEEFAKVADQLAGALSKSLIAFKKQAGEMAGQPTPAPAPAAATAAAQPAQPTAADGSSTGSEKAAGGGELAQLDPLPATGETAELDPPPAPAATGETVNLDLDTITTASSDGNEVVANMIKAAMVEWIGSHENAKAPRDITAWAVDRDLETPDVTSMEVRLLISKQQLDTLYTVLKSVLSAGRQGQIGGGDFFEALQATAATTARNPELLKNAKSMAATGLIPEFLEGLPYHSRLMDMNSELWNSWSVDEQDEFLNNLEALIEAYRTIHDSPEGWITLNPGDDADQTVYPLALEMLP